MDMPTQHGTMGRPSQPGGTPGSQRGEGTHPAQQRKYKAQCAHRARALESQRNATSKSRSLRMAAGERYSAWE